MTNNIICQKDVRMKKRNDLPALFTQPLFHLLSLRLVKLIPNPSYRELLPKLATSNNL